MCLFPFLFPSNTYTRIWHITKITKLVTLHHQLPRFCPRKSRCPSQESPKHLLHPALPPRLCRSDWRKPFPGRTSVESPPCFFPSWLCSNLKEISLWPPYLCLMQSLKLTEKQRTIHPRAQSSFILLCLAVLSFLNIGEQVPHLVKAASNSLKHVPPYCCVSPLSRPHSRPECVRTSL